MKTRENPKNPGARLFPTQEEVQKELLKKELLSRHRIAVNAVYEEQRAKQRLRVLIYGPLTKEATKREAWRKCFQEEIRKAARAIACARGSDVAMFCDFREAAGNLTSCVSAAPK